MRTLKVLAARAIGRGQMGRTVLVGGHLALTDPSAGRAALPAPHRRPEDSRR
jgi:hypothetical protein